MAFGVVRKAQPTASDVHINRPLTNISVAYVQSESEYIAGNMFPVVPVPKKSDTYHKYTKNDWFRDEAQKRAPSTESAGSGYTLSTDTYNCDVWAFHKDIDDQVRGNYDSPLDPDRDATEFVTQRLLLSRDRQFADTFFKTGVWDTDVTGGGDFTVWSDYTNSNPIGDVTNAKRAVKKTTGYVPNVLMIGGEVWDKLKDHSDIIERIKYTQSAVDISPQLVAQVLGVQRIVIADAIYATNNEGAEEAYDQVFGKNALLCYAAPRPSLLQPSAGYIFAWTGYGAGNAYGVTIGTFRMENLKSERVEGELAYDMKVVAPDLGYFFSGVVA